MKRIEKMAAAWLLAAALLIPCARADAAPPQVSAASALLLDCASGRVLYEKNADSPSLIASTTKMMTALLVLEQCNPASRVQIPAEAAGVEGSSMYLKAGEVVTVQDLLYGLMLQSGNDAAVALAIYCAGDVGAFVAQMNEKARALGLHSTTFANPNGLDDDNNRSTARDLAALAAACLQNEDFVRLVSTKNAAAAGRSLTNHNKLLWRYEGCIGVKTGYTKAAGRILVSAARRDGRTLVAVTLGAPDDWNDHTKMLDHGFGAFRQCTLVTKGAVLGSVRVLGQDGVYAVPVLAARDVSCALLPGEASGLRLTLPGLWSGPAEPGAPAGEASCWVAGECVGKTPLVFGPA